MADITQNMVDWLKLRPEWQQVAAERILASGVLSEADIAEITELAKRTVSVQQSSTRSFDGLKGGDSAGGDLRLVSIGDIHGIESLGPYRPMNLGDGNLVVG